MYLELRDILLNFCFDAPLRFIVSRRYTWMKTAIKG